MRHYSQTRLNLFETCPCAYKFKYVDHMPGTSSEAMAIGKVVHEAIAEYNRHLLKNKLETDVTAIMEIAYEVFYKETNIIGTSRLGEIEQIMENFAQSHILNLKTTVGIEETIKTQISDDVCFMGIIDLLEIDGDTATIIDYKTDWAVRPQYEVDRDFQLRVYAWLVAREYPQVTNFKAKLDFVRHSIVREVEMDIGDVLRTEAKLLGLVRLIENEKEFPPQPGAGCAWCNYIEKCSALKNISNMTICKTKEDAIRIAGELAILEKQVSDRKEALKNWCTVNGPVVVNGLQWGFYPTLSKDIDDIQRFIDIVKELGDDPYRYLSVDGRKTRKLWSRNDVAIMLNEISKDKGYTSFKCKKATGDDDNCD